MGGLADSAQTIFEEREKIISKASKLKRNLDYSPLKILKALNRLKILKLNMEKL